MTHHDQRKIIDELRERSKLDNEIIVGSEIRLLCNIADDALDGVSADSPSRGEERQRIARIKRATCLGCLAAALGQPLHAVAESGYAARSYEGDAWEAGWEFMNGSATWKASQTDEGELRIKLVGPIAAALGDLLITAADFDEEATDTAERLYRAAKDCGIDVSSYDEQMTTAVAKFHEMTDLDSDLDGPPLHGGKFGLDDE